MMEEVVLLDTDTDEGYTDGSHSDQSDEEMVKMELHQELAPMQKLTQEERAYQSALIQIAITQKRNLIVCLPTGSGKTFIALQVAQHFFRDATKLNQIVVFLACSVPLVHQQANYFREAICPNWRGATGVRAWGPDNDSLVVTLTGELDIDKYSQKKETRPVWQGWMRKHKIFVMTPAIFKDCLNYCTLFWNDVSLVIFDECHNAVGNSHYAEIMRHYKKTKAHGLAIPLPQVLGLTATIINGKGASDLDSEKIKEAVRDIERRFHARAITHRSEEEVLMHSTNAKTKLLYFGASTSSDCPWNVDELTTNLKGDIEFLGGLDPKQFDQRDAKARDVDHGSLTSSDQLFKSNSKSKLEYLEAILKDVVRILTDLGPYCCRIACHIKYAALLENIRAEGDETFKNLMQMVNTTLFDLMHQLDELMDDNYDHALQVFISDKLLRLCICLENPQTSEPFYGLVFAKERLTVQVLHSYVKERAEVCPASEFIKAGFVVGRAGAMDGEIPKQAEEIEKFYEKEYNILFSTSVLEEGIDIPSCNAVIRFDRIETYASYAQSMGRARQRDAIFFVLVEQTMSNALQVAQEMETFRKMGPMLAEYLRENVDHLEDEEDTELLEEDLVERIATYCPGGTPQSPQITATDAISRVNDYCSLLPSSRFEKLSAVSWWSRISERLFKVHVQLPANAVHTDVVEGDAMESKSLAKRSAFMKVCKILHEKGGLGDNLKAIRPQIPKLVLEYLDEIEKECREDVDGQTGKPGTNKRRRRYTNKVPSAMCPSRASIRPGVACAIYAIEMELNQAWVVEKRREEAALYDFQGRRHRFAIAMSADADLSRVGSFSLFPKCGELLVSLKKVDFARFSEDQIKKLQEFQVMVLSQLAELQNLPKFSNPLPYLIVPLKKKEPQSSDYALDWNFVNVLKNYGYVEEETMVHDPPEAIRRKFADTALDLAAYEDAIFVPWHESHRKSREDTSAPLKIRKCCVAEVSETETPSSPFENEEYKDYLEYYQNEFGLTPFSRTQPLLKCKKVGKELKFLRNNQKIQGRRLDRLLPEFCHLSPIPASYFLQAKFLPCTLQRISRLLLAGEIEEAVADHFSWEAAQSVNGEAVENVTNGLSNTNLNGVQSMSLDAPTNWSTCAGPPTPTIMEALTLKGAGDNMNLERLEMMGDSVLKLLVTQFIFTAYPDSNEGCMTELRNRLVFNDHLYYFAKKIGLGELLSGSNFNHPETTWLPPGLPGIDVPQEADLGDKSVADGVEALIGAYYLHGGLDSAARVMEWIGLRGPRSDGSTISYARPAPPLEMEMDYPPQTELLPSQVAEVETALEYKFRNQWLLVEALTHPGCKGGKTSGYQRLEFLGDAILDFLVTNHIYELVSTPGQLTDLKSALVNNVTFASLTVRHDLQKHLRFSTESVKKSISGAFVQTQKKCRHEVTIGHFNLLSETDCFVAEDIQVPKLLGDIFESLAGAVYVDSGFSLDTVWRVFHRLMKKEIDIFSKAIPKSPVRDLHEMFPGPGQIKFSDVSQGAATGEWTIVMKVKVPGLEQAIYVYGCGTNKKNAKAAAAKCAVRKLSKLKT